MQYNYGVREFSVENPELVIFFSNFEKKVQNFSR